MFKVIFLGSVEVCSSSSNSEVVLIGRATTTVHLFIHSSRLIELLTQRSLPIEQFVFQLHRALVQINLLANSQTHSEKPMDTCSI